STESCARGTQAALEAASPKYKRMWVQIDKAYPQGCFECFSRLSCVISMPSIISYAYNLSERWMPQQLWHINNLSEP
ncbi:MAG: hypothetical protein NTX25_02325, partial [Proteobacteria bacterium]|nr:hypothetical protein [Pseudomonadota bacterium]